MLIFFIIEGSASSLYKEYMLYWNKVKYGLDIAVDVCTQVSKE